MKKIIAIIIILAGVLFLSVQPKPKKQGKHIVVFYTNGGTLLKTIEVDSNGMVNELVYNTGF